MAKEPLKFIHYPEINKITEEQAEQITKIPSEEFCKICDFVAESKSLYLAYQLITDVLETKRTFEQQLAKIKLAERGENE